MPHIPEKKNLSDSRGTASPIPAQYQKASSTIVSSPYEIKQGGDAEAGKNQPHHPLMDIKAQTSFYLQKVIWASSI